ncbi:MAG: Na+/H+ antiporter NhaA [Gemmataceae bacterium]
MIRRKHERGLQLILRPLVRFLHTEASSGIVLLICTGLALALANSSLAHAFHDFWTTNLKIGVGSFVLDKPLEWWVNDCLMTLFFFVVGLEIKRELVAGELRDPRKAALPAAAALGGMIVPALIYLALRYGREGERGWGIPMATDIAFVVGVMALLGPRVPAGLKILLLSLAIVDDLGAVLVIALAYSENIAMLPLGVAFLGLGLVVLGRFTGVRSLIPYILIGLVTWFATYLSGIHPTIAGVMLGLLTASEQKVGRQRLLEIVDIVRDRLRASPGSDDMNGLNDEVQALVEHSQETLSPLDRFQSALHPWVAFGIMPLFALANAGVVLDPSLLTHPVATAASLGLILGKPIGIFLFSWLSVRSGLARMPQGVSTPVLFAAGCLGGIGFTMSLFIAGLALEGNLLNAGKVGILTGSLVSALVGSALLLATLPRGENSAEKSA